MQNKFKKVIYNEVQYRFTLPKMFVSGENEMTEMESTEEKFLNYLIMYEKLTFTPEIMNYELTSICQKNDSLQEIFKESCANGTIFVSKLRMENEEKEAKRFRQYITREDHKHKFCAEYKAIVKEKLKLLEKESKVVNNE
jgi:cellulose biosynthesis protein BcsQ